MKEAAIHIGILITGSLFLIHLSQSARLARMPLHAMIKEVLLIAVLSWAPQWDSIIMTEEIANSAWAEGDKCTVELRLR